MVDKTGKLTSLSITLALTAFSVYALSSIEQKTTRTPNLRPERKEKNILKYAIRHKTIDYRGVNSKLSRDKTE